MARIEEDRDGDVVHAVMFDCPGCKTHHLMHVRGAMPGFSGPTWVYNGNPLLPTIEPSILCTAGPGWVCHSFVRAGRIEFLGDCTHALAGQTVDLAEIVSVSRQSK